MIASTCFGQRGNVQGLDSHKQPQLASIGGDDVVDGFRWLRTVKVIDAYGAFGVEGPEVRRGLGMWGASDGDA